MNNEHSNKEQNSLERQLEEINECQKNAYNPGHFIRSGKVQVPMYKVDSHGAIKPHENYGAFEQCENAL